MFYVMNLSKPRKYIISKYNDIAFEYKLNPQKINKKILILTAAMSLMLVFGITANAVDIISQEHYRNMLNYYIQDLHYPKNLAEKLINQLSVTDFEKLYSRMLQEKETAKELQQYWGIGEKLKDVFVKAMFN